MRPPVEPPTHAYAAPQVMVHGSGWVAQTAAVALSREGLTVALTQAPGHAQKPIDHRAMALNAASRELLLQLDAWPHTQACPVTEMCVRDGTAVLQFRADEVGANALTWIVPGAALSESLATALKRADRVQCVPAVNRLADAPAGLHLVCEGAQGALQLTQVQNLPYGQTAVAAVLELPQAHRCIARQWFESGEVLALLPLLDERTHVAADSRMAALVWSVSTERATTLQASSDQEFTAELAAATQMDTPPRLLSPRQAWPLVASRCDDWMGESQGQSWVLAGDSAHRVHPLAGLGLNLGLGDVALLASQLRLRRTTAYWRPIHDPALLRPYVRERQTKAAQVFAATDALFHLHRKHQVSASAVASNLLAAAASAWPGIRQMGVRAVQASPALKRRLIRQAMA